MTSEARLPSSPPDRPEELLRAIAEAPVVPMPAAEATELRARTLVRMEAQRSALAARRARVILWRNRALAAAAAALVPLMATAAWRWHGRAVAPPSGVEVTAVSGTIELARDGVERDVGAHTAVDPADELRTGPGGLARAALPTGTEVKVGPSARVRFAPAGGRDRGPLRDRVELLEGRVDVQVPKLADGDEMSVHSEGVMVVVHGTKFSVEHLAATVGGPGRTRVEVREGRVAVYAAGEARMLTAGAAWTVGETTDAPPPSVAASTATVPAAPSATTSQDAEAAPPRERLSTLAAENALLADAMRRRRRRDRDGALAALDELLARYPRSPLAETARVERLRVLGDMGAASRVRSEAERYLADYPRGFARREVSRMLGSPEATHP